MRNAYPNQMPHNHVTVWALEENVCGPTLFSSLTEDYRQSWRRSFIAEPNHSLWWSIWVSHMCCHTLRWGHVTLTISSPWDRRCVMSTSHQCLELPIEVINTYMSRMAWKMNLIPAQRWMSLSHQSEFDIMEGKAQHSQDYPLWQHQLHFPLPAPVSYH